MGLLGRAENIANTGVANELTANMAAEGIDGEALNPASGKIEIPEKDLVVLKKRISEYQEKYRVFGCILLEDHALEESKTDFYEKLIKMTGNIGSVGPVNNDHALILLPSEMDGDLIAHRLSKSLIAGIVLSFRAASPEYVLDRINSVS
jgi:hypothetical protein